MAQELEAKSVLVLYTGGTIGMKNMGKKGLAPAAAQEFKDFLWKRWQYLNVPDVENRVENGASLLMKWPLTEEKIILSIWILCYDPLMDSSNMAYKDWMKIANDIKENYQRFDGFVVLHGTDTMAYTASALSFIFTNLIKSVVLTGSQVCSTLEVVLATLNVSNSKRNTDFTLAEVVSKVQTVSESLVDSCLAISSCFPHDPVHY
ncbi:L-asparaginase 1-like, partial [Saccostrea cucullata]|uniref:L-asparaginase 1-like n=1 Tax=Saccostrea cuccullata TaxID=36930 RepID=UPI002ED29057